MNPQPRKTGMFELPRGSVVGKYEIMRRLATGGMAEIYLARVTGAAGFEKLVVLKRILPSVAEDPAIVQMFLDEAKIAATLRHPNIADVYDVGEDDGTYFFTMECVYGQDVRSIRHDSRKRNEPIPLAVALAIVHGTASALDHAHEKVGPNGQPLNLIHRDVSASNVMVSYDGAVKLLDFGIARAASSTHKTQTGTLKGKVPYMAPEQCKGLPMDRRSDLFSLGVVFYELTVGRRPFRGDSDFDIMDQIVHKGAARPSEVVPGFPDDLEAMIMKLLARAPSERYATGEHLLQDLDAFVSKHGLWLSPRAIGKYMRALFADKILAWEQAEQQGVSFAQHVAHSITSQSQRSELLTPPTEIAALPPGSDSQQMLVVARAASAQMMASSPRRSTSQQDAASTSQDRAASPTPGRAASPTPTPVSQPVAVFPAIQPMLDSGAIAAAEPPIEPPIYAALEPRSSRTIMLAFAGALLVGAGGVFGFMMSKRDDKPAAVDTAEPVRQMAVEPVAAPPPPAVTPPVVPVDAQPTVAPPTTTPPADTKPVARPAPTRLVKPKPKKPIKKPEPKEQTWDPNSPFLPH